MTIVYPLRLTLGEKLWIPTTDGGVTFDSCSIQALAQEGDFDSGVITVKKSNDHSMAPVASGAVTITATGTLTELTGSNWFKAEYIVLDVTTSATGARTVQLAVTMKKLGFSV